MTENPRCLDCNKELGEDHGVLYCTKCKLYYRLVLVKVQTPLDKILRVEVKSQ